MEINKIVQLLRDEAVNVENKQVLLPAELVDVINGNKKEQLWTPISAGKVMSYIADMMEE